MNETPKFSVCWIGNFRKKFNIVDSANSIKTPTKVSSLFRGTWPLLIQPKKAGKVTMMLLFLNGQKTHQTWATEGIYEILSRGRWETPEPVRKTSLRSPSKQPQSQQSSSSLITFYILIGSSYLNSKTVAHRGIYWMETVKSLRDV